VVVAGAVVIGVVVVATDVDVVAAVVGDAVLVGGTVVDANELVVVLGASEPAAAAGSSSPQATTPSMSKRRTRTGVFRTVPPIVPTKQLAQTLRKEEAARGPPPLDS
jgi:hypothetical protein